MGEITAFHLETLWKDECGQDLVEYSLLSTFIALAAIALLSSAGHSVNKMWSGINSAMTSAAS
jgi:Flp pilus assembly pilin Flp